VLYCKSSDTGEPSKDAKQKSVDVLAASSTADAFAPTSLAGAGLTSCSYNDALHFFLGLF
jgi:hypothetical protein